MEITHIKEEKKKESYAHLAVEIRSLFVYLDWNDWGCSQSHELNHITVSKQQHIFITLNQERLFICRLADHIHNIGGSE
jgi:hypothetical protein